MNASMRKLQAAQLANSTAAVAQSAAEQQSSSKGMWS